MGHPAFTSGAIDGVIITLLPVYPDHRGRLSELFRIDEMAAGYDPLMATISWALPGIARGPHEHRRQSDLLIFVGPTRFRLILWDNRPGSPTHWRRFETEFSWDAPGRALVPPGVVHAYQNMGEVPGFVINVSDTLYRGRNRREPPDEIRHEQDPQSPFRV